ncbi:MAG TPA: hypothetical protein VH092_11015 [Urbifossiella sp.]|nr:hypothetical protein [Urbifossiella sp.]
MAKTLVKTLQGPDIAADLERAYVTLAAAFLKHRGGDGNDTSDADPVMLDQTVCATEKVVDLRPAQAVCDLIAADEERPGEIFDNLGHMFVLLQAIPILRGTHGLIPQFCAPTQQSKHEGNRIADLQGEGWVLEAYGGVDVRNNDKLALDLRALFLVKPTLPRTFLAFRESAYGPVTKVKSGNTLPLTDTCPVRRGDPFAARTTATVVGRLNGVVAVETGPIEPATGSRTPWPDQEGAGALRLEAPPPARDSPRAPRWPTTTPAGSDVSRLAPVANAAGLRARDLPPVRPGAKSPSSPVPAGRVGQRPPVPSRSRPGQGVGDARPREVRQDGDVPPPPGRQPGANQ